MTVASQAGPSRCAKRPTSIFFCALPSLRSARRPTARWTQTSEQCHVKETPCPEGQVKNTLSTTASQSFHGRQRQKTDQAHVTCNYSAGRTVDLQSCGNKCSVHVEVGRRRTRGSTRGGWGGGAFAGGECGMKRTLGVKKRS